jgi:nitrogen fixation NifU-like protein
MSDLRDLYQEVILDHNRQPRNYGALAEANRRATGHNPLCGDRLVVFLRLEGETISDIRFEGSGCAISKASASLMTESVKGKTTAEVDALFEKVHRMLTGDRRAPDSAAMGKLQALSGISEFPVRVKCATLAWHTLKAALHESGALASTE